MQDLLIRIKRTTLSGHYAFSRKARIEMQADGLTELDVTESILNAVAIYKRIFIYTKGKFVRQAGSETYYFLISSKRAI